MRISNSSNDFRFAGDFFGFGSDEVRGGTFDLSKLFAEFSPQSSGKSPRGSRLGVPISRPEVSSPELEKPTNEVTQEPVEESPTQTQPTSAESAPSDPRLAEGWPQWRIDMEGRREKLRQELLGKFTPEYYNKDVKTANELRAAGINPDRANRIAGQMNERFIRFRQSDPVFQQARRQFTEQSKADWRRTLAENK